MGETVFTEFFRNAGFSVYTSPSSNWYEVRKGILLSIPYHQVIEPSNDELDDLLSRSGAWGVRYPTKFTSYGFPSSLAICSSIGYNMAMLKHRAKNRIRKGEANFEISKLTYDELVTQGLVLNQQTCLRQGRSDPKVKAKYWSRICEAVRSSDGVIALGAYHGERLAAYMIILETPTTAELIMQNSDSNLLELCPNNILTYTVTKYYLTDRVPQIAVCYGLGSLEQTSSLDHFKVGMGYELIPIKQRLYFRKSIRWMLNPALYRCMQTVCDNCLSKNYFMRKSCGLLRNYLGQV